MSSIPVQSYVGVYHADGGPIGEIRYVVGHLLGTAHCGLCDVTHTWRRKPEWDRMVDRLGVPFELYHLNEMNDEVREAVEQAGSPAVFARTATGLRLLMDAVAIDASAGSVDSFEVAIKERTARLSA